jgi:hypothetical protein
MKAPRTFIDEFSNSCELRKLFSSSNLERLARESGFVKRGRDLTGAAFLHICTFFTNVQAYPTHQQMLGELWRAFRIHMSRSSLNGRFTAEAAGFVLSVLREVARLEFSGRCGMKGPGTFSDVILGDSSVINLAAKCADEFAGSGGGASAAAAKLQLSYGLASGELDGLSLHEGTASDSAHRHAGIIPGALYLNDLGYFNSHNLRAVIDGGAWFVSRYKYGTGLFRADGRAITARALDRLVRMLKPGQTLDMQVLLFKEAKVPLRLVLHKLPRAVGDECRRKLKADKQRRCRDMSPGRMAFCDVNAYVTNIDGQRLPAGKVREVYGLRWQAEVMFKSWKSGLGMDKVRNIGTQQFKCMVYGALLRMLLCVRIFWRAKAVLWRLRKEELSELKGIKFIGANTARLREWLVTKKRRNATFLGEIWTTLVKTCLKEKKRRFHTI